MLESLEQSADANFELRIQESPEATEHLQQQTLCNEMEKEIVTMAAQINAVTYRFIKLLAEFDENGGWHGTGIKSFGHWLNWKIGMGKLMARERVRVARALNDLPLIDAAFSKGELSYSKVRAMTRVATPENEHFLMRIAREGTAATVELLVQKYQLCKRLQRPYEEEDWKRDTELTWYQEETGMYIIRARLPAEEGALVIKALDLIVAENKKAEVADGQQDEIESEREIEPEAEIGKETETEVKVDSNNVSAGTFSEGVHHRNFIMAKATALVELAENYLSRPTPDAGSSSLGEKYQVFLHINTNAAGIDCKISQADLCSIDNQRFLTPEVAKRLACDASITTVLEDDNGTVMDIGRRSRIVTRALSHAIRIRDAGCRYPGCSCSQRYTDIHHIKHWADGGETNMSNLLTLCRFHHTSLHKDEYHIEQKENGDVVFINKWNIKIHQLLYPQFANKTTASEHLAQLEAANRELGLNIDEQTAESKWDGGYMDIQHALLCIHEMDGE